MAKDPRAALLNAVRRAREAREAAADAEVQAVADARNAGVTWQDIADALGMKQSNAVRKYRPLLEEHRVVTVRQPAG